jgi:tetratricopeptide (TPR) repeat protein
VRSPAPAIASLLVAGGLLAAVALQVARERWYPTVASPVAELYFTSGETVGRLALSFKSLLADVYWIRAIQYFAATRLKEQPIEGEDLLYPLLDVTTTLDPAFNIAYRFGAVFLAEGSPTRLGRPEQAIALLDKGYRQNPHRWQYLYDKAYVYYWSYNDYPTASHWFKKAAAVPGSPEWLPGFAAYVTAQGGDRRSARVLFQQILQTADQEYLQRIARWRLEQLDILDVIDRLQALLDRHAQQTGERPLTWAPLISRGLLRQTPVLPDGTPFLIDPATGRVGIEATSRYAPLPNQAPERRDVVRP